MLKLLRPFILLLALAACVILWIFTFRIVGLIVFSIGWVFYIIDDHPAIKIVKTVFALVFLFILHWVAMFLEYRLETEFFQPCWSPDGKQIAFFMNKRLSQYQPGFGSSVADTIFWSRNYLCTMDYDGKNFKTVKETKGIGRIMWPAQNVIVFSEEKHGGAVIDGKVKNTIEGITYKINPDGTGFEKLWQWNEKSRYQDVVWLTPDTKYLVTAKPTETGWIYSIYDRKKNKIKKELPYKGRFYGSYKDSSIAIDDYSHIVIINLDTLITKIFDSKEKESFEKLLAGFEYGSLSPDRSMTTDDVFIGYNKKYGIERTKRSYLFNIFGE